MDQENGINEEVISIPLGYRFRPKDEVLIYYLQRKVNGESLPSGVIIECNVYSEKNPWELERWKKKKSRSEATYVFTKLQKRSRSRFDRKAGWGTWKGQSTKRFYDQNGNILWSKKDFVFEVDKKKTGFAVHIYGHWLMQEFSLSDEGAENYVLCKIWDKCAKNSRKKKQESFENEEESVAIIPCIAHKRKLTAGDEKVDENLKGKQMLNFDQDHEPTNIENPQHFHSSNQMPFSNNFPVSNLKIEQYPMPTYELTLATKLTFLTEYGRVVSLQEINPRLALQYQIEGLHQQTLINSENEHQNQ